MRRAVLACIVASVVACRDSQDRTPATVLARTPATGDQNAFVGAGIEATFSERLDPATVSAATVHVTLAGEPIDAAVSLRSDGRTVSVTPAVDVVGAGAIAVELTGGIADRAGNAFAGDTTPWTFEAPAWARIGAPVSPAYATDPVASVSLEGGVVVGMAGALGASPVARWDGAGFEAMPSPWPGTAAARVSRFAGTVWAAGAAAGKPWVACWGASGWRALALPATAGVALDAWWLDSPRLVTLELRPEDGGHALWLVRSGWTGREWIPNGATRVPNAAVHLASQDRGLAVAYAAWSEDGEVSVADVALGGFPPLPVAASQGSTSVAVGQDGWPLVALHAPGIGVVLARWDRRWEVSEPVAHPPAGSAVVTDVAYGAAGAVVAWAAPDDDADATAPRRLHVAAPEAGLAWGPLNADPDRDVAALAVALDDAGAPVVGWAEDSGLTILEAPAYRYHAARRNWIRTTGGYDPLPVEPYDPRYDGACDRLPPVRPPF